MTRIRAGQENRPMSCNSHIGPSTVCVNGTMEFITPEIAFSSDIVCFDFYSFFAELGDNTEPLFQKPKLRLDHKYLSASFRASVMYVCTTTMSSEECTDYYNRIKCLSKLNGTLHGLVFTATFLTPSSFKWYCHKVKRIGFVEKGWVHVVIQLPQCPLNLSGCLTCPLKLLQDILYSDTVPAEIIPFQINTNRDGQRC